MEQKTSVDASSEKLEDSSNSPPKKKRNVNRKKNHHLLKPQVMMQPQMLENLNGANHLSNQHPTNTAIIDNQQPSKDDIFDFILLSEDDFVWASEENLDPNSAGLASSRTGGVWNKSLEEAHSAQVKERSLLGHLVCSEETQKKDFRIGYLSYSEI